MWYRVLKRLSTGHQAGGLVRGSDLPGYAITPLLKHGAIAEAHLPPLSALSGWTRRGERCAELGIVLVGEFLDADAEELAVRLGVQPKTVVRWQAEAAAAMVITNCQSGSCRRR